MEGGGYFGPVPKRTSLSRTFIALLHCVVKLSLQERTLCIVKVEDGQPRT